MAAVVAVGIPPCRAAGAAVIWIGIPPRRAAVAGRAAVIAVTTGRVPAAEHAAYALSKL